MNFKKIFIILSFFSIFIYTCSNKKVDAGILQNNIYVNEYFNMKVKLPDGWYALSDEEKTQMMIGFKENMVNNLNTNEDIKFKNVAKAEIELSIKNSIYLFVFSKNPYYSDDKLNYYIYCLAEKVPNYSDLPIKVEDYFNHSIITSHKYKTNADFIENFGEIKINEFIFKILYSYISDEENKIYFDQLCNIYKGYAINFMLIYSNDDQKKELYDIINTIEMKK